MKNGTAPRAHHQVVKKAKISSPSLRVRMPSARHYSKPVELASGRYALIEKSKEFTLVPWRSVLERARGQSVSGIMSSGGGISWNIGRKKGIGIS